MTIIWHPSPNFDARQIEGEADRRLPDLLVMHYTGMETGEAALERLCDPDHEIRVSAHYLVMEDGTIYQMVREEDRAWHAGVSYWQGDTNNNACSVGIEIVNPGHEFGYRPFPQVQMDAVLRLAQGIIARHDIQPQRIVGHSDVAPARKTDPGELFPWRWLAEQGVGFWPEAEDRDSSPATIDFAQLNQVGYGPLDKMQQDESFQKQVIEAFQRRYRPENINGQWDAGCQALLAQLLA